MTKEKKHLIIGSLAAMACEALFGLSYLFTKQATGQASALALLGWRFLVAFLFILLLLAFGLIKMNLNGKNLKPLMIIGFFSPVLYFIGETFGISLTTASESGAFLAAIPVLALLSSSLILKQKPNSYQVSGILVTLIGVLITVFAVGLSASFSVLGYLMLLLAVIGYALYCVYVEKAQAFTGMEMTFIMIAMGCLVFVILAILEALWQGSLNHLARLPLENTHFLWAILYQGIGCSVLAFFLSNFAISRIGVNRAASFIGVSTVVSIVSGLLFLKESFSIAQIIGVAFIMVGVYVANLSSEEEVL